MKIIILSHVIHPTNNARANRTMELAAELSNKGHQVVLYSALGRYEYKDLESDLNIEIKSLGDLKVHVVNSDGRIKNRNFLITIFRYFLRPIFDLRELELTWKCYQTLKFECVKNANKFDLLISIAPPHSINWGCALFKTLHNKDTYIKKWIADCGDPYMKNPFHKFAPPFYFKYVEKWFCKLVDFISIPVKSGIEGYYEEFHDKIRIIPQGVNFNIANVPTVLPNNKILTFVYSGALYKDKRDPKEFLHFLSEKCDLNFRFILFTKNKELVAPYKDALGEKLIIKDYLPRKALIEFLATADFLVNFENIGSVQSPSKLIDYSLAKRPILSISMENMRRDIIEEFLVKDFSNSSIVHNIDQFNIETVTEQFLALVD